MSGFPKLKELVVDGCHSLGQKAVRQQTVPTPLRTTFVLLLVCS